MKKITITNKSANFSFRIAVDNSVYEIGLQWNVYANKWFISLDDAEGVIYQGVPLVAGIDFFNYIAIEKMPDAIMFVSSTPTYETLGETANIYFEEL